MSQQFWALTQYDIPYNSMTVFGTINACFSQGLLSVLESDSGDVVGFVAGLSHPCIANDAYILGSEIAFWIDPPYRGHGTELLRHIEQTAHRLGITYWSMMALENMEPERIGAIYEHLGYDRAERTHVKRLN